MESEVRQIQLKCLEILRIVDDICIRHNIKYSLNGGSVVGAYLYQGCLPWDDDIDILMTRKDYNKFIKIAPNELPKGYSIENYQMCNKFKVGCTTIIDDNTTLVEKNGHISGVFLDLTVYDKVPNGPLRRLDVLLWKIGENFLIGKVKTDSFIHFLRNLALTIIPPRIYFKFFQFAVELLSHTNNYTYSELFGGGNTQTKPYAPHIFEHFTKIKFEDKEYMIMRDYIDYMTTRYERTDFREPKEKQVPSHYKYVNFNLPWCEYLKQQKVNGV